MIVSQSEQKRAGSGLFKEGLPEYIIALECSALLGAGAPANRETATQSMSAPNSNGPAKAYRHRGEKAL